MKSQVTSVMNQIVTVVQSSGNKMRTVCQNMGRQSTQALIQALKSAIPQISSVISSMISTMQSVGMRGVGTMRQVGAHIGQGLAQGMYSALGEVTAAANALIEQAERAAQAKAKIHSPSRLFRDKVGYYIGAGIAVGIDKSEDMVSKSFDSIVDLSKYKMNPVDLLGASRSKLSLAHMLTVNAVKQASSEKSMQQMTDIQKKAMTLLKTSLNIDGKEFAKVTQKYISEEMAREQRRLRRVRGDR